MGKGRLYVGIPKAVLILHGIICFLATAPHTSIELFLRAPRSLPRLINTSLVKEVIKVCVGRGVPCWNSCCAQVMHSSLTKSLSLGKGTFAISGCM